MFLGSSDAIHLSEQTLSAVGTLHPVAGSVSGWGRPLGSVLGLLGLGGLAETVRRLRETDLRLQDEDRLRREVTAYLTLDLCPGRLSRHDFGRLVCRTVATRSSFARAALLLPQQSGVLAVAGSAGMDDLTVQALDRWGASAADNPSALDTCDRVGAASFVLGLERRARRPETAAHSLNCAAVHLVPMRSSTGLLGALAVCATVRSSVHGALPQQRLQRLMEPLEALALTLTLQLGQTAVHFATEGLARPRPHPARSHLSRSQLSPSRISPSQPDRSPIDRPGRSRRRADHTGAPAPVSTSRVTLQQLAGIAAAATARPATGPAGVMVGFPAIASSRALPVIAPVARQISDQAATVASSPVSCPGARPSPASRPIAFPSPTATDLGR